MASGRFVNIVDSAFRTDASRRGPVTALAADGLGNVYFSEGTRILVLRPDKGNRFTGYGLPSTVAEFEEYGISVGGMAVDEFGRIWFSDPEHRRVRVLEPVEAAN